MNEQYATYQVPIWQAGWARSVLNDAGIPVVTTERRGDILIIVIPAQFAEFNHRTAAVPHKRRRFRLPSARVLIWLAVVAIGGVVAWVMFASPGAPAAPQLPALPVANGVEQLVDSAVGLVKAVVFAVIGLGALFVAYKFRGPLASFGGALGNLAKGFRHGR